MYLCVWHGTSWLGLRLCVCLCLFVCVSVCFSHTTMAIAATVMHAHSA